MDFPQDVTRLKETNQLFCMHHRKTLHKMGELHFIEYTIKSNQNLWGGLSQWLASRTMDQGVPGSRPGRGTVCCGLWQVTFTHCLNPGSHGWTTPTNCDEAGGYVVPNVLSPRDLVSRPD